MFHHSNRKITNSTIHCIFSLSLSTTSSHSCWILSSKTSPSDFSVFHNDFLSLVKVSCTSVMCVCVCVRGGVVVVVEHDNLTVTTPLKEYESPSPRGHSFLEAGEGEELGIMIPPPPSMKDHWQAQFCADLAERVRSKGWEQWCGMPSSPCACLVSCLPVLCLVLHAISANYLRIFAAHREIFASLYELFL